ncbi:hypothetical protein, partial [Cloacibacillus porcorum]|uniref:hypothetical protein n=1 Tax=Cloacibacillus porcorum TaxID=1197717 RepID=UPI0023F073C4
YRPPVYINMALVPQDIIVMYKRQLYLVSLLPPYMYRISLAVQFSSAKERTKLKTQNRDRCNIFVFNESAPPPRSKVEFKISLSLYFNSSLTFTYTHTEHGAARGGADER